MPDVNGLPVEAGDENPRRGGPYRLDHGMGFVSEASALVLESSVSDSVDAVHSSWPSSSGAGSGETDKL